MKWLLLSVGLRNILVCLLLATTSSLLSYIPFPGDVPARFGYVAELLTIVDTSYKCKTYSTTIGISRSGDIGPGDHIMPEVQREPLYPAVLMLLRLVGCSYVSIVWLQLACLTALNFSLGLFCWRRFGGLAALLFFCLMAASSQLGFYASILYPYIFHCLLLALALLLYQRGNEIGHFLPYALAGFCMGLAIFERGSFLLLPLALLMGHWCCRKWLKCSIRGGCVFVLCAYAMVLPWLIRNERLGASGMNQMLGRTLGSVYGDMPGGVNNTRREEYDKCVREHGQDSGTYYFIVQRTVEGAGSLGENEKLAASIILSKVRANPLETVKRILLNAAHFPIRLVLVAPSGIVQRVSGVDPWGYYLRYANTRNPAFLTVDILVFVLAMYGLLSAIRRHDQFAFLAAVVIFYVLLVSTTVVKFDPRYRSIADPLLFMFAAKAVVCILRRPIFQVSSFASGKESNDEHL